jgi:CheR methyltransferase, SAM binding domain
MSFVRDLNRQYFGGALSSDVMALLAPIDDQRVEVQQFVARMFRQMHRQLTDARDFSERVALVAGALLQRILPGAWGAVPPITQAGRHVTIDDYLARNPWRPLGAGDFLLDLGCGFPPVTTLETAERFPQVSIVGADPSFGEYLVREATGDYVVFDATGSLLYFQPSARVAERWRAMFVDPTLTRERFAALLAKLRVHLPDTTPVPRYVSDDGVEIIRNPIAGFERSNVKFRRLGIGESGLRDFTAARCFNVLYYFDHAFQQKALRWLADTLVEGGISVTGADSLPRGFRQANGRGPAGAGLLRAQG